MSLKQLFFLIFYLIVTDADVAKLADAYGLGPYGVTHGGSIPSVRRFDSDAFWRNHAGVAQLVERNLAKVEVTGSNPASRSKIFQGPLFVTLVGTALDVL